MTNKLNFFAVFLSFVLTFTNSVDVDNLNDVMCRRCYIFDCNETTETELNDKDLTNSLDFGKRLYLTPLINSGNLSEARRSARVHNLTNILSFSGFLTVNETFNSNLFFWFFPAAYDYNSAPVLLWLNGGPGTSSLFGLFLENGPIGVDKNNIIFYRTPSWAMTYSVLYIDNPVGTVWWQAIGQTCGKSCFSFTGNSAGYATTQDDVANNLHNALVQFFTLFPELQIKDFYLTGESYAGKYLSSLAMKIHESNKNPSEFSMNMKGILIISGFMDPFTQHEYAEFYYNLGLVDDSERQYVKEIETNTKEFIKANNWTGALTEMSKLMSAGPDHFLNTVTGFKYYYNYLLSEDPNESRNYKSFLANDYVHRALQVGDILFDTEEDDVYYHLLSDIIKSVKFKIETLLNANYKILLCASLLDITVPHVGISKVARNLQWHGTANFTKQKKKVWLVNNAVAGYTKTWKNFVVVHMRNAGHNAPKDQPIWSFDMLNRFTHGIPF